MSEYINQAYAMDGRRRALAKSAISFNKTGIAALVQRAIETLARWQERINGRHALLKLDDRMLRDIGISRADAAREADKPFWRR